MRHHHPHHHHKMGQELVGMPDNTLQHFLTDPQEFSWVLKKIINEGPPPKQIRNAILLKELSKLVKIVSSVTGKIPAPVEGIEIESDDPENDDYTYPVQLPGTLLTEIKDRDDLLEWIGEGPPHDVLRDILMIAIVNWILGVLGNEEKIIENEK